MKHTVLYILLVFTAATNFWSCSTETHRKAIMQAEEGLAHNRPDSAYRLLSDLKYTGGLPAEWDARYCLAYTEALCRMEYREGSDSLIRRAMTYYKASPDSLLYTKSLYWAAVLNGNNGWYDRTDSLLDEALTYCPKDEYKFLVNICRQKGYALLNLNKEEKAVRIHRKELEYGPRCTPPFPTPLALRDVGQAYRYNNMPDSALYYYLQAIDSVEGNDRQWQKGLLSLEVSQIYATSGDYEKALTYALQAKENRLSRWELPMYNLALAQIYMYSHQLDSARTYFVKAIQSTNPYVSTAGYQYLMRLDRTVGKYKDAYHSFLNYQRSFDMVKGSIDSDLLQRKYQEGKLENENNLLKLAKKERELYLLILFVILLLVFLGFYLYYMSNKKRKALEERKQEEERLRLKAQQLENENLLLKQQQELSLLQQKAAELRESLFRKLPVVQKIPSLDRGREETDSAEFTRRITLTDDDWNELIQTINEAYSDFALRLQQHFPLLNKNDVAFCCLLKIKVAMKDLSDIYCISKAGITKKKTRLKNEKFNLTAEEGTLDEFLQRF